MRMLRCRICGDTYLGTEAPSRCPFCVAASDHFVEAGGFSREEDRVPLTEVERDHIRTAVGIERSNARYYLAAASLSGDEDLSSAFKRLAKVEAEHCVVFSRLLGEPRPDDLSTPEGAPENWCAAIEESRSRETRALSFYDEVFAAATNDRVREVFSAIREVERDHLVLDEKAAAQALC